MTLAEIAAVVQGQVRDADPSAVVTGPVEYDSRKMTRGGLFLALPGERVDGHDYVAAAVEGGAVAALVSRPVDAARIEVADGVAALTALAAAVARRLAATVVGITGSSGKTSTKDLVAHLLAMKGQTVAPAESMNNELGLPYTVLLADADTRFLVLEMGSRGIGHLRHLTAIAPPRIGVVLNVGRAHLGEFGTQEVIAEAKGELVEALGPEGVAVLNADDSLVVAMATRTFARVVTFGESTSAHVRATDVTVDDRGRPAFRIQDRRHHEAGQSPTVRLQLVGAHQVGNALAAAAVALEAGLPLEQIAAGLTTAVPTSRWRMEVTERADGVLVINDAYNANPESMRAALQALASVAASRRATGGRSFAVLGPMAELGPDGPAEHYSIGQLAVRLDISHIIAVSEVARPIQRGAALESSWSGEARWVPDVESAIAALRRELRPGDVVLVKASRAASLERVALAIAEDEDAEPNRHAPAPGTQPAEETGGSAA